MLGRLALVIHWLLYLSILGGWAFYIKDYGFENDWGTLVMSVIPLLIFTVIYWIVKNKWAFFPWQHNKD